VPVPLRLLERGGALRRDTERKPNDREKEGFIRKKNTEEKERSHRKRSRVLGAGLSPCMSADGFQKGISRASNREKSRREEEIQAEDGLLGFSRGGGACNPKKEKLGGRGEDSWRDVPGKEISLLKRPSQPL